jgi:Telomere regulation protein Stn1
VRVTGVIVAVDEYPGKNVYTVDDSSGMCVECVCVAPAPAPKKETTEAPMHLDQIASINQAAISTSEPNKEKQKRKAEAEKKGNGGNKTAPSVLEPIVPWEQMEVGTVIKVKGRVGEYWKQTRVEVVKIEVLRSTDQEVKCWNEVMDFKRDVLGKAWIVTEEEEERCRRVRERELRGKGKGKDKDEKRKQDREEARRKRKGIEGKEDTTKRTKERGEALTAKNMVNCPSLAMRKAAAGKYDALGR